MQTIEDDDHEDQQKVACLASIVFCLAAYAVVRKVSVQSAALLLVVQLAVQLVLLLAVHIVLLLVVQLVRIAVRIAVPNVFQPANPNVLPNVLQPANLNVFQPANPNVRQHVVLDVCQLAVTSHIWAQVLFLLFLLFLWSRGLNRRHCCVLKTHRRPAHRRPVRRWNQPSAWCPLCASVCDRAVFDRVVVGVRVVVEAETH